MFIDRWPLKENGKGVMGGKESGQYSKSGLSKEWLSRLILSWHVPGRVGTKENVVQMRDSCQAFGIYFKKCYT